MFKVLFLYIFVSVCSSLEFEKYFKTCNRNSPDLNECMADAVRHGISNLVDGIEEMDIPPLDPFVEKELKMEYNANQITAKVVMKNIKVGGLKTSTVHGARVRADDEYLQIEIDMTAPTIHVEGEIRGVGQYNALKISATGDFNATMTDLTFTWKLEGIPEKIGSETYVKINSFYMRPDVGNMVTYFNNKNPETKELTSIAVQFANQNWKALYNEFLPFAQTNWNKIGVNIANKIFRAAPYDTIIPPVGS